MGLGCGLGPRPGQWAKDCLLSAVHRIGRTGRSGNTGIATTFINKACGECTAKATTAVSRVLQVLVMGPRVGPNDSPLPPQMSQC